MDTLFLNFSTFYQSAIKNNTNLSQFNAVNVLLLGNVRDKCTEESIDDPSVSGYVSGKKTIRKNILASLLNLPREEIIRRLQMLGIQDIQRMVDALTILINEVFNLSNTAKAPLIELSKKASAEYDFVAEVFLTAVKCPTIFTHRLSREMTKHLNSLGWPEQFIPLPKSPDLSEPGQEVSSEPDSASESEPTNKEKQAHTHPQFSQEAKELSVSYRSLSIPEDKETAASYFLDICGGSFINFDYTDVACVLSEEDGFCYFMVELQGTQQSVIFELSHWKACPDCTGFLLEIVTSEGAEIETIEEIASKLQSLVREDATAIFGTKFAPDFLPDQVHVYAILQIRDTTPADASAGEKSSPSSEASHKISKEAPEEDPFEEIFRIFNKSSRIPPNPYSK